MATPTINFASLGYDGSNNLISNEQNINDIRITGDFVSGNPTIQNCVVTLGPLEFSDLMVGMVIVASGKLSGDAIITDISGDIITVNQNALANGNSLGRIRPPKGQYLFVSASFTKVGNGYPADARAITGSEDTDYDSNLPAWGIAAQLAYTGSTSTEIKGLYGQYKITKIIGRNNNVNINFFATASDTLPSFIEDAGAQITSNASSLLVSQIENNLITIVGASDLNASTQGLGLAGYQTAVASVFATLISSSAVFPFTGSAAISGSIDMTGSFTTLLNTTENFIIKNVVTPTQSLFEIDDEGIAIFRVQPDGILPTPVVGGMYFTTSSAYIGFEGT
jgi:hypothetical protein